MAGGRPTDYTDDMPEAAIRIIGDEGKSITQFARDMRISRQTVYQWAEDHAEFSDALTRAKEWSEAYWEDKMVDFMVDRDVNAPLVKLYMANRFRWRDKPAEDDDTDTPEPTTVNINVTDARARD